MASKTFCPIMMIGFNPPEEGKRDMRLCNKDCAWYDIVDETCKVNKIAEQIEYLTATMEGIGEAYYDPIGISEEPWDDPYGYSKTSGRKY